MIKNYFKIAWRSLFGDKGFSIINLLGLMIGITSTVLILLWVQDELNFDKFQKNYDNIYQVLANRDFNDQIFTDQNMVLPLADAIQSGIPEVKSAVVMTGSETHVLSVGDKKLKKQGYTVGEHFFDIFSWEFIAGNASTALPDPYSIVLTKSAAEALFGKHENIDFAINKVVKVDNEYDAKVTAIVNDVQGNSSFQFDFVNLFNYQNDGLKRAMTNWVSSSWRVYIQTVDNAEIASVNQKINEIKYQQDKTDIGVSTYFGFPMENWRLHGEFIKGENVGGRIEYVRLFAIIAFIILLIACVNFMNLSTARSSKRAKEIGIRKSLGSGKSILILQFIAESILFTFCAFILSMVAVLAIMPLFNQLVGKSLSLDLTSGYFWLGSLFIILFTGILSGSYPAFYLSSFSPIGALKGKLIVGKHSVLPRQILVVGQYMASILLISATIIVYQQIQHIKTRDIGYNPNNLIMIPISPDAQKNYDVIKRDLIQSGAISDVTRSMSPITDIWWSSPAPGWPGKPDNTEILFTGLTIDKDFSKTMGIKMLQGTDFSGMPVDSSNIIFNKAAADIIGSEGIIGMKINYGRDFTVIGIMDNVTMASPFEPVKPMMIYFDPQNSSYLNARLSDGVNPKKALEVLAATFKKYDPIVPFEYSFIDKEFERKFESEDLMNTLTNIFAGLAIFICCLGMAGLVTFTIQRKIREIGIRKVLGATVSQILQLVSQEFIKLVFIAFLCAIPLTLYFMNQWLSKYDDRISISIWLFGIVGMGIVLLTLIVVCSQTIKAALMNPVKSLKGE